MFEQKNEHHAQSVGFITDDSNLQHSPARKSSKSKTKSAIRPQSSDAYAAKKKQKLTSSLKATSYAENQSQVSTQQQSIDQSKHHNQVHRAGDTFDHFHQPNLAHTTTHFQTPGLTYNSPMTPGQTYDHVGRRTYSLRGTNERSGFEHKQWTPQKHSDHLPQVYHHDHSHFPILMPPPGIAADFYDAISQTIVPMTPYQLEQENLRLKAKIQLLERKIRVKDQLFEDSLSSSFAGCAASSGSEYTALINKLKKKVINLQAKNEQSEQEIKRLTKTIRVVEVEVKEENEPLRNEITRLTEICELLQQKLDSATHQLETSAKEKTQLLTKFEKVNADFTKAQAKIAQLEQQLQQTQTTLKSTTDELKESRENFKTLEKKLKDIQGDLLTSKQKKKNLKKELKHFQESHEKEVFELNEIITKLRKQLADTDAHQKKTEKELRDRIKQLEHDLEKTKGLSVKEDAVDSDVYKKLQNKYDEMNKKYERLKDEYEKLQGVIATFEKTVISLQELLTEKDTEIHKLRNQTVHVDVVVKGEGGQDSEQMKIKQQQTNILLKQTSSIHYEKKFSLSDSDSDDAKKVAKTEKKEKKEKKDKKEKKKDRSSSSSSDKSNYKKKISILQKTIEESQDFIRQLEKRITELQETHKVEISKLKLSQQDKIVRLEAELDELYTELDRQTNQASENAGDAFAALAMGAQQKKVAEDLKVRQGREIRELNAQLRTYLQEITKIETEMKVTLLKNTELIAAQGSSVKVVDKFVRMERIVPEIIERVVQVETIVEKESIDAKIQLTETEKALLRKEIKAEIREKIKELEANILAYQDLLIAKETDIKAYAIEIAQLQKYKMGTLNDQQLIESLKQLLAEKQLEIEQMKNVNVKVGHLPSHVYKKLEHINAQIDAKLEIVHKNYKKEIMKLSDGFLKEITQLKVEKQEILDSIPSRLKELQDKHKVELEQMYQQVENYKEAFNKKSAESLEFQAQIRKLADQIYELQDKIINEQQKNKRSLIAEQEKSKNLLADLNNKYSTLQQDYQILMTSFQKLSEYRPSNNSNQGEIDKIKTIFAVQLNKLEIQIRDLEISLSKKSQECADLASENKSLQRLSQRCQQLEKDSELWIRERDRLIAKFKTDLEVEIEKYNARLELAVKTHTACIEIEQKVSVSKQHEIDQLMIRLEQLETSKSSDTLLVQDIHHRYQLQIKLLQKEAKDANDRFQKYYTELQLQYAKNAHKREQELLQEIEVWRTNERALIIEHQMTLETKIKETRAEMQIEIDKLRVEIQLLLERLSRKDAEIRKLIIQLEEWKEWKIKYEELYKKYTIDIQTLRQEYEKKLSVLQAEYDRLKKEHSVCPQRIRDLEKEIQRLLLIIEGLKKRPKTPESSYRDEVSEEEKLEVVQVLAVKTEEQQFEVVEEKRQMQTGSVKVTTTKERK